MPLKIIIADDSEWNRDLYKQLCQKWHPDTQIEEVIAGTSLVDRVLAEKYDLVITDNSMSRQDDGLDAIRKIRLAGNAVPIYMISGDDVRERALAAGATHYSEKSGPTIVSEMRTTILNYLSGGLEKR